VANIATAMREGPFFHKTNLFVINRTFPRKKGGERRGGKRKGSKRGKLTMFHLMRMENVLGTNKERACSPADAAAR